MLESEGVEEWIPGIIPLGLGFRVSLRRSVLLLYLYFTLGFSRPKPCNTDPIGFKSSQVPSFWGVGGTTTL